MTTYCAILFTPDGEDYVTDFRGCKTKDEVWAKVDDMGSRWYFYPIVFVITESNIKYWLDKKVVDVPDIFSGLKGVSLKSIKQILKIEFEYDPTYWTY